MSNANPPKKNQALTFNVCLRDVAVNNKFKSAPVIQSGDFVLYGDGALIGNITTPTVVGSSPVVVVALTAPQMNYDVVMVVWEDTHSPITYASGYQCIETTA